MPQSAFIVRVPEAEPHVAHWRERFDPSALLGVPAHITLLFPFMSPELVTASMLALISSFAASLQQFTFQLGAIGRFSRVLYLAPTPSAPFVELTNGLVGLFPEFPPYGGHHEGVVPHLTVAQAGEAELLQAESTLVASLGTPIAATCSEFVLIENSSGLWKPMHAFALGVRTQTDA
jgi:2'-5' RNA ligase